MISGYFRVRGLWRLVQPAFVDFKRLYVLDFYLRNGS